PGANVFSFIEEVDEVGVHKFEAILITADDPVPENNRFSVFAEVKGKPKVLHITEKDEGPSFLKQALQEQGIDLDSVKVAEVPNTLSELLEYDAIIFDGTPAFAMSSSKMELIEKYVRDAGGGVILIGGENSFGAGGYYRTPIERLSPVNMDIPAKITLPSLALVVLLDKSGSMGGSAQKVDKLEIAKMATFSAIELLNPFDLVGLLAFDADFRWTVPITEAGNRGEIARELASLSAGGGTKLYEALVEAYKVVSGVNAMMKHLIVLSDGLTDKKDFRTLALRIAQSGVTISTVAVGEDSDRILMSRLAEWTKGRSYYTDDPLNIPRIFTTETILVSRGLIVEEPFVPLLKMESEIFKGIDWEGVPNLRGYVVTYPKPSADVILTTPRDDPLLATWRYGLGRTVAFMSDLSSRWGSEWVQWKEFGKFTAQLLRWTERRVFQDSLRAKVAFKENKGVLSVDFTDREGNLLNYAQLNATVVFPSKAPQEVGFHQTAPGRYEGEFQVEGNGDYFVTLFGTHEGDSIGPRTIGLSIPYSPEFANSGVNQSLLTRLAELTGGKPLDLSKGGDRNELFVVGGTLSKGYKENWRELALLAFFLFLLDIAVRKLFLPQEIILKIKGWLRWPGAATNSQEFSYTQLIEMMGDHRVERVERRRYKIPRRREVAVDPSEAAKAYMEKLKESREVQGRNQRRSARF
ncbi:MAG: VWA domain-containing protein, partial [Candidatus Tectomicrobia bacterium]|nr:VWA domain-containing protein [Candidatus Tectomicrobia bacterium]